MEYLDFNYIFPPRPKNAIPSEEIDFYNNRMFFAQPKLNGSNCVIFTNGIDLYVMNRHGERMTRFQIDKQEILALHRCDVGKWMVINGEYMNKSKKDANKQTWNHKLVIFDILVYDNEHLIGKTFDQRVKLLDNLYGKNSDQDKFLYDISDNVKRVKSYTGDLTNLFKDLVEVDMYEGLVIKRKRAKLEMGLTESNNINSQIKCRKPTRNYSF